MGPLADTTVRAYAGHLARFEAWCAPHGFEALPPAPQAVTGYVQRQVAQGRAPATIRQAIAALRRAARERGVYSDVAGQPAMDALLTYERERGRRAEQARPIREADMNFIIGRLHGKKARRDEALLRVMRDGALRRGETAVLRWEDLSLHSDGGAALLIRRSKTDKYAQGAWVWLSWDSVAALRRWHGKALPKAGRIFEMSPGHIGSRIGTLAQRAGMGAGYSGHSLRVGVACDLADRGASEIEMARAGRWKSPTMPLLYAGRETAGRGAVKKYLYNSDKKR